MLGNAFFVAASFAVVSVRPSQLEPAVQAGNRRADVTIKALRRASRGVGVSECGEAGDQRRRSTISPHWIIAGPARRAGRGFTGAWS
ncbi:MAG: hypothetical protein ACRDP8_13260 [Actinopolymorphaceae bacterium]